MPTPTSPLAIFPSLHSQEVLVLLLCQLQQEMPFHAAPACACALFKVESAEDSRLLER